MKLQINRKRCYKYEGEKNSEKRKITKKIKNCVYKVIFLILFFFCLLLLFSY